MRAGLARFVACALLSGAGGAYAAAPCAGVDRGLSASRRAVLEPAVAAQMQLPAVEVLDSFRHGGWSIIYVNTFRSDEAFLFYDRDPVQGRPVTLWGGGAAFDEGPAIRRWVLDNARGIPERLGACFAWHVTQDRSR